MPTEVLTDIISRCHQRREEPLKQRKTISTPPIYKGLPYHFTVYCAHRYRVLIHDLKVAEISFLPIGQAPGADRSPRHIGGERFEKYHQPPPWDSPQWHKSSGIHVYTGVPSSRDGALWHDIHFKYDAICTAPDAVLACVQALVDTAVNPLLTLSMDGGLRFSCRIPGYLHPNSEQERFYIYRQTEPAQHLDPQRVCVEISGEKGYTCWDARHEILMGDLLDPPVIHKEVLFAPINALRAVLHHPVPHSIKLKSGIPDLPYSLGSLKLDLAKEAFLKYGFTYLRQEDGVHYWSLQETTMDRDDVSLWENEDGVWIRAATDDTELPTETTLITDVWNDTGILPPIPVTGIPMDDKVCSVREGTLSPLSIKRPKPILEKSEPTVETSDIYEAINILGQRAFDRNVRVLGFGLQSDLERNRDVESFLRNGETICLNVPNPAHAESAELFFQQRNLKSAAHMRNRMYLWDKVKDIPVDVRMATPFKHGNVCEDPERCEALEKKGGDPSESICPHCPVYTTCKQHGYLSQLAKLQNARVKIVERPRLFVDPHDRKIVEQLVKADDETLPLCIINGTTDRNLFLQYELSKTVLEEWRVNWHGRALGNFAIVLLNAAEIREKAHADTIRRLRTVVQTFEWLETEIIQQMCHLNVSGRVIPRGVTDTETGSVLAQHTIEFEEGISAYIPMDVKAADKLAAQALPVFHLDTFVPNEDMEILLPISDAIRLGFLDAATPDNIMTFPTVCRDSHWTFWHQLKRFFAHYKRDTDAPMRWQDETLLFSLPPVLHPNIRRLLVNAPDLSHQHLCRVFPDTVIEMLPTQPRACVPSNRVFQIRTNVYPRHTIFDVNNTWDVLGFSESGQHLFWRIQDEIERDPTVKHGIIVDSPAIEHLKDIAKNENVCFLTEYKQTEGLETAFQEAHVIWIVGTPNISPHLTLKRVQCLYGNDAVPLSYEMEPEFHRYKDERVQSVYEITVIRIFKEIFANVQLYRSSNKKIMLITSLRIPEITDRAETLLFDWEDLDVADGLDTLAEVIATRQRFETERDNLTSESSRLEVERVLGCIPRQANRVLQRLRGGKARVPFREQIFALLADGEKTTQEIVAAIAGHPKAINALLTRLVKKGDIVKIKQGLYVLPKT